MTNKGEAGIVSSKEALGGSLEIEVCLDVCCCIITNFVFLRLPHTQSVHAQHITTLTESNAN